MYFRYIFSNNAGSNVGVDIINIGEITGNDHSLYVAPSAILTGNVANSGTLTGGLHLDGTSDINLDNSGVLDLVDSIDNYISGDFDQDSDGELAFELDLASSYEIEASEWILTVDGETDLDGLLNVTFADGFSLNEGDTFQFIDVSGGGAGSLTLFISH